MAIGSFANLRPYQLAVAQPTQNPLDALIQGINTGQALQQLPEQIAQDQLSKQLALEIQRQKLEELRNPNLALARQVQKELALRSIDPTSGIIATPEGVTGTIATPRAITPEQQAILEGGGVIAPVSPGPAITPIAVGTTPTGFSYDISVPQAARQAEEEAQLRKEERGLDIFKKKADIEAEIKKQFEKPERHTLSPGQTVIDGSGNVIFSIPKEAKESKNTVVPKGATVLDAEGNVIFSNTSDVGETSPYVEERIGRTLSSIEDLKGRVSPYTTGVGSLLSYIPGTSAKDFEADVKTLKASIQFGELAEMRDASKTGGALGSVSDFEGQLLQSALGSLDEKQSPANFLKNLNQMESSIKRFREAKAKYRAANKNAPTGKIIITAPDGTRGYWDSSKPIPAGYR